MADRFRTTHWSVIARARADGDSAAAEAMSALCESYWYPLYAYVRSRGYDAEEARDLTQGYFAQFLEKRYLDDVERSAGRFRAFLLTSLKHYLSNERDRADAQKRGGGRTVVSLDGGDAEERYRFEPVDRLTPELVYERRWALTVLEKALRRLQSEEEVEGRGERFALLRPLLTQGDPDRSYAEIAAELGASEGAIRTALHRLRRRFGETLRSEIAQTVAAADEVDDEVKLLLQTLA